MEDNEVEVETEQESASNDTGDGTADETDEEEEHFDITLAATHSYMGPGLETIGGRSVLEAGWRGRVPVVAHHGTVFPGETVPMLLPNPHDANIVAQAIKQDKLFGLLCPNENGNLVSGYGVLCEVFEAVRTEGEMPVSALGFSFKARATHRFRLVDYSSSQPIHTYSRMRFVEVRVLPELCRAGPLWAVRLASLDPLRSPDSTTALQRRLVALDAAGTAWPAFVYGALDYRRMRNLLRAHFCNHALEDKLPSDPVSLSFWTASNLLLSARERLSLFRLDCALQRLHAELRLITRKSQLCCTSCSRDIARREDIFAMSSEGVHSNYTNLGGYMHDIVTVSRASNIALSGAPSTEYSWFPGYAWHIALCSACMAHVGWRFTAMKRNLRPQEFYGLCRNYVLPRDSDADEESDSLFQ